MKPKKINAKFNNKKAELLDEVIDKCLSNSPEDRYQKISDFENAVLKTIYYE